MDPANAITRLVMLARENAKMSREEFRKYGVREPMAFWFQGRSGAYLRAARSLKGHPSANIRNMMNEAA